MPGQTQGVIGSGLGRQRDAKVKSDNTTDDAPTRPHTHRVGRGGALVESSAIRNEGRGLESCSSRHVGTLGKSFAYSCLCASG